MPQIEEKPIKELVKKFCPYARVNVQRQIELTVPKNTCLDDLLEMTGGSYGDFFSSTRQKIAAWYMAKYIAHTTSRNRN